MTSLTCCPDPAAVAERAAAHVARSLARAAAGRGAAHLALSGGTTPGATYGLLAGEELDWGTVHVWFADERCVGPEDEESNYLLARRTLLDGAPIPAANVHRMQGELGPVEGAALYAVELARGAPCDAAGVPVLDVIVLGIGPDGHVASLFPGASTLDEGPQPHCIGIDDSPKPPPERLTLSLPVLHAARECVLLATGSSKADAVAAMLGQPSRHVPASLLRRERLRVIADDAAAPGHRP